MDVDLKLVKVDIRRGHNGHVEEESAFFNTPEEARDWADLMRDEFGYRHIWIDGVEYQQRGKYGR